MGANCCIDAKHNNLPPRRGIHISAHRNVEHSPSWSFQWNNRTHADVPGGPSIVFHGVSRNLLPEATSGTDMKTRGLSDVTARSSLGFPNSPIHQDYVGTAGSLGGSERASCDLPPIMGLSFNGDLPSQGQEPVKSPAIGSLRRSKVSSHENNSQAFREETSSSHGYSFSVDTTSSRRACQSPCNSLCRQSSGIHFSTFKTPNEKENAEERQTYVLSVYGNDLSAGEPLGGPSNSWPLRLFSELVPTSQKERWSYSEQTVGSISSKMTRPNGQPLILLPSAGKQSCGVCSKLLDEGSSWSCKKLSNSELPTVAVLDCGHVYHAECLECVTLESDRFDPPCPACVGGESAALELLRKGKSEVIGKNKTLWNAVTDIDLHGAPVLRKQRSMAWKAKDSKDGSTSFKALRGPFLRRHFTIASRPTKFESESKVARKKNSGEDAERMHDVSICKERTISPGFLSLAAMGYNLSLRE